MDRVEQHHVANAAGVVLLEAVVGSTAYGMATADSDLDLLAVHAAPTERVLSLAGHELTRASYVTNDPDRTSHELGKFVSLALRANPTVVELLWAEKYTVATEQGHRLIELRSAFWSTDAVKAAYGGYVRAQLARLARRGDGSFGTSTRARTEKHARHCRRLLIQGEQVLRTGRLHLDCSHVRDELFAAGALAAADPATFVAETLVAVERLQELDSVLPEHPDVDAVDQLVVDLRLAALTHNG